MGTPFHQMTHIVFILKTSENKIILTKFWRFFLQTPRQCEKVSLAHVNPIYFSPVCICWAKHVCPWLSYRRFFECCQELLHYKLLYFILSFFFSLRCVLMLIRMKEKETKIAFMLYIWIFISSYLRNEFDDGFTLLYTRFFYVSYFGCLKCLQVIIAQYEMRKKRSFIIAIIATTTTPTATILIAMCDRNTDNNSSWFCVNFFFALYWNEKRMNTWEGEKKKNTNKTHMHSILSNGADDISERCQIQKNKIATKQ